MPNPNRKKEEEREQRVSSSSSVIKPSQKFSEWYNEDEVDRLRTLATLAASRQSSGTYTTRRYYPYNENNWNRNMPDSGDTPTHRKYYLYNENNWNRLLPDGGENPKVTKRYLYNENNWNRQIPDGGENVKYRTYYPYNENNWNRQLPDGGDRTRAAFDEFMQSMQRANQMRAADYAINEILGRTEPQEEPGTAMAHYNKYDDMSADEIMDEWDRYKDRTAQDLSDARMLLNMTFAGVSGTGYEDIRNRLSAYYGIDAYDADSLQGLVDDLTNGKVYLPDGTTTTYSALYSNASSKLPQKDIDEITRLRSMSSSDIQKQYESQDYTDHDTLQQDKNTVDFLLQNADTMRDYPEGSWEYEARQRISEEYGVDPKDEQALQELSVRLGIKLINNPKAVNSEVAYTDSNGTSYMWRDLYYEAENREQFGRMGQDEEALKLMTEGYSAYRMINYYGSVMNDAITTATFIPKMEALTPQLDAVREQLAGMGYDFNRMAKYLDTDEAKQNYLMQLEADATYAQEHPWFASLYSVLLMPITSLEGAMDLLGGIGSGGINTPLAEYVPLNYYDNYATNARDTMRGAVQQEIYNDLLTYTGDEKVAKLGQSLYSGTMSVADSRMSLGLCSALFGPLGEDFVKWASLIMMGSSAAGEEYKQQIESGNDNTGTLMMALAAGFNEIAFEKLSLDKLLEGKEVASWDWDDVAGSAKKIIRQSFVQRGIEGSEEVFTSLANMFAARLTGNSDQYKKEYDSLVSSREVSPSEANRIVTEHFFKDLFMEDFFGGFLAGGGELNYIKGAVMNSRAAQNAMAPVTEAVGNYQQNRAYRNLGAGVVANQNESELVRAGQQSGNDAVRNLANQIAENRIYQQEIEKPSKKQQRAYNTEVGKLASEVVKENAQTAFRGNEDVVKEVIRDELKNRNIKPEDYVVDVIAQVYNNGEEGLTKYGKSIAENVNASEIAESVKGRADEIEAEASKRSGEAFDRLKNVQSMVQTDASDRVSDTGEVIDTRTGKAVEIGEFVKDGDNITLTTKDGGRVSVADLQFANPTQAVLYDQVQAAGLSPEVANSVIKAFDGQGTSAANIYVQGMLEGMAYGRTYQTPDMDLKGPFFSELTPAQKDLAVKLGTWERNVDLDKAKESVRKLRESVTGNVRTGSVTGVTSKDTGLNNAQRTGIRAIEMLVDNGVLKNNFRFYASEDVNGKRVLTADVGGLKKGAAAPNGWYDSKTGDIYIDVNAGNAGQGTVLFTAAHELTHFVKDWSLPKFNDLASFLVEQYHGAGVSIDSLVRDQQRKGSSRNLSYDEAFEEMVADSMQTMFTDGNLAAKLMALKERDKTLFDKIMDFVKKLQTGINKVYAKFDPEGQEGKALAQIKGAIDNLADIFAGGITEATENYATVADNMTNEAAFADSDIAIKNQIRTPYTEGTNAWREFIDGLNPEARETHDLFYNFYTLSRLTNTTNAQGKPVKNINISSVFLTAQQWNEKIAQDKKWNECAKKLAASLPDQVRKNMNFNLDGTLTPVALETRFKMQKSMAQRLVDSLGFETIDNEYELGGKKISLNTAGATQSVGGEAYRRALINETRKLYDAGKLKQVSIHTMSKDRWGSLGFLAANEKTGASGDLTTLCPQMMYNEGCFYCYRRAAMETGVNNKLVAQSVWYTGEILRIKDADIESLNEKGGLRIQSFGDWMPHFSAQLADILYDAETRGLQVKIITKEPSMIDYVARLRDQGIGLNLYFNISADYAIERGPSQLDNFNPDSLARVNPDRPFMRGEDNSFWWKRALAVEEGAALRKKYPWVNVRIVATTQDEFIRGLKDPNVQVVTGYHGNKREWDRVDSTTGEHKVIMEALGDAGMPRFRYENGQWVREYDGKTKTHQALANAIEANGLQQEYYIKTCCITGRCATCQGKCGAYANSFYVKNATNDPQGTAYWYNQMSNVQLEETDAIEVEPSLKQSARTAEFPDRVDSDVDTSNPDYHYSARITDPTLLDSLNNQEYITTYRTMQIIDGGLYSPMNSLEDTGADGKRALGFRSELGQWEMATEAPEKTKPKKLKNGDIVWTYDLKDAHGNTDAVAYNPYEHSANYVLNDQFTGAYKRKNIVVVECRVPVSEANGAYRAEKAHNATGWTSWHKGPVAAKIAKATKNSANPFDRQLFLSRYLMPVRIVPDAEVATMYGDYLRGTGVSVNWNVVSPSLLEELVKQGVPVTDKPSSASVKDKMPEKLRQQVANGIKLSDRDISELQNDIVRSPEYQKLNDKRAALLTQHNKLQDELHNIPSRLPESQWTDSDREMVNMFGKSYSPVNPEWTAKYDESQKVFKDFEKSVKRLNNMILNNEPALRWADLEGLMPATQDEYEGFRKNDTGTSMSTKGSVLVEMSPAEYLRRSAAMFNEVDGRKTNLTMQIRGLSRDSINKIKDAIRSGEKMYTPWLDETGRNGQEGRHRAAAAYELGIDKIPVVYFPRNDIRYSTRDSEGNTLTPEQQEFFKDSKVRDDEGRLKPVYHGTGRMDRVGTVFRADRATSGPMAFFTDSRQIAENYSRDKKDTSTAYDEVYENYNTQFRVNRRGKSISVTDLWYLLSQSERDRIMKAAPHVTFDDDYENIIYDKNRTDGLGAWDPYLLKMNRGNALKALTEMWLYDGNLYGNEGDFLKVLELVGLKDVQYFDPEYREEGVFAEYLNITNPFDAVNQVTEDFVRGFEQWYSEQDASKYKRRGNNADMWDKNNISAEFFAERMRDDIKNGNSHAWTSIPDSMTDYLKSLGYDGIKDLGGKQGGEGHTVYIPFYSEQVKNIDNLNPTTDPDIRFSERDPDSLDTRTVLSNALLDTAQNDQERKYIADYQAKIQQMNEEQNRLNEIRAEIKDLSFKPGPRDTKHLKALREEANKLANRINIYDKQLLHLESMAPMKNVVNREKQRVETRIKNKMAAQMTDYRNKVESREYITRIEHEVKGLRDRLLHPKAKTVIPEAFARPVADFLSAIDFGTYLKDGTRRPGKANEQRRSLQESLAALSESIDSQSLEQEYGQLDISPDMQQWIKDTISVINRITEHEGTFTVNQMSTEELKDLYKMVTALRTAINGAGKMYTNMSSNVMDLGIGTIDYLKPLFDRERSAAGAKVFKTLGWDYSQPATVFDRFGPAGQTIFKGLIKGQKKEAQNVQQILDFVDKAYTEEEINDWREEMHDVKIGGNTYNIPTSYIMELYCMLKDADARRHILEGGGIRFDDLTYGKTGRKKTRTFENTMISNEEVQAMIDMLTPRQKEVADEMQEFMDRIGADWGNEISMKRFGYHAFGQIENYYPIKTIKQGSEYEAQQKRANIYALLNKSFTKERVTNANNAVIIGDMFKTFSDHMSEMAVYNSWALPVIDTIKWFNYREAQDLTMGTPERSVKDAIRRAYGAEKSNPADEYIRKLLESINGQRSGGLSESFAFRGLRMVNRVAVAGNIRVAVQQPFSITRAFELLNPKYVRPMSKNTYNSERQEMLENSSFGRWKDMGYYDVDISTPIQTEILKNSRMADKITEKTMVLAEKGDRFTWTTLWHGCKLEAKEKGLTGQEAIDYAAEKFDDIIVRTQVVDSVLTKSQWMRSDKFWHRMTSAFMSEPMTSYNTMLRQYDQFTRDAAEHGRGYAWKKNKNGIMTTAMVFTLTQLVNALVTAPIDASRDDDDYKTWMEKMLEKFKENFIENMIPTNMMPFLNNVTDYLIYGSQNRSDLAMYTRAIDLAKEIYNIIKGENTSIKKYHKAFMSGLSAISSLTGLPLSNIMRDFISIYNTMVGDLLPAFNVDTEYGDWKFQTANDNNSVGYEQFIKALDADNSVRASYIYQQMIHNGVDDNGNLNSNILNYFRKHASGDPDSEENAELLAKIHSFFGENEEVEMTDEKRAWWAYTGEHPDTFLANTTAFKSYYEKIMPSGISAEVYNDYRQEIKDNGYNSQEEIIPLIDSLDITREQKDVLYCVDNNWQKSGLENTPWHSSSTPGYGDYTRRAMNEHLENYMSMAQYREYLTEVEPYGIDDFTWTEYSNFIKKVKGVDTTGDGKADYSAQQMVMDYIDELPLTDKQKDVLYLKKYSEKNIDNAPWHQR